MNSKTDPVYREVQKLVEASVAEADLNVAMQRLDEAWQLVPEPKMQWKEAGYVLQNRGETYEAMNKPEQALEAYRLVLAAPNGDENSMVHLGIGRILFDQGHRETAHSHLRKAWLLTEGRIFLDVDPKYRKLATSDRA